MLFMIIVIIIIATTIIIIILHFPMVFQHFLLWASGHVARAGGRQMAAVVAGWPP